MPKGVSTRPASAYPPQYMQVCQHVLTTNEPFVVDTLHSKGQCVSMRQSMNTWRQRLRVEGSPLAPELYGLTLTLAFKTKDGTQLSEKDLDKIKPSERPAGKWVVVIRPRDKTFEDALKEMNIPEVVEGAAPIPPEVMPSLESLSTHSEDALKKLFESDEE